MTTQESFRGYAIHPELDEERRRLKNPSDVGQVLIVSRMLDEVGNRVT